MYRSGYTCIVRYNVLAQTDFVTGLYHKVLDTNIHNLKMSLSVWFNRNSLHLHLHLHLHLLHDLA